MPAYLLTLHPIAKIVLKLLWAWKPLADCLLGNGAWLLPGNHPMLSLFGPSFFLVSQPIFEFWLIQPSSLQSVFVAAELGSHSLSKGQWLILALPSFADFGFCGQFSPSSSPLSPIPDSTGSLPAPVSEKRTWTICDGFLSCCGDSPSPGSLKFPPMALFQAELASPNFHGLVIITTGKKMVSIPFCVKRCHWVTILFLALRSQFLRALLGQQLFLLTWTILILIPVPLYGFPHQATLQHQLGIL